MEQEKRMAGDYEIIHAIHVGAREVVVGVNAAQEYFCGFCTQNDLFCSYTENMLSNDYLEVMTIFSQRLDRQIQAAKAERKTVQVPLEPITSAQCLLLDDSMDIMGKVMAVRPESLRHEYRRADRQIILVTGGFGAHRNSRGSAVFGINLFTGRSSGRWERRDMLGELQPEHIPDWAQTRLKMIERESALEGRPKKKERGEAR